MASVAGAALPVYLNAIFKRAPLHFLPTLLSFYFARGHGHFSSISCFSRTTCISRYAEMKVEALCMYFFLFFLFKSHTLCPEYQLLIFNACSWTPIALLAPDVAAHLKFDRALWGRLSPSEVMPVSQFSIITFVSLSFMQTGSNLESSLPFTQYCNETQNDKRMGSCLTLFCWCSGFSEKREILGFFSCNLDGCRPAIYQTFLFDHWRRELNFMYSKMHWWLRSSWCSHCHDTCRRATFDDCSPGKNF